MKIEGNQILDADGYVIADMWSMPANAKFMALFAAAPVLLEALKILTEDDLHSSEGMSKALAAIAKAEGRSE